MFLIHAYYIVVMLE